MNNNTRSMTDQAAAFHPTARSNLAMIQAVTCPSNISSTVSKGSVPGSYASVVPTSGIQSLKGIMAGSKMSWWAGFVIGVAIVAIILGGVFLSKLTKKSKMRDVEIGSIQQLSIGSQSGKAFIARYLAVRRSILAVIPGTSQVPTRDDIVLAELSPPATLVVPATTIPLQYAHGYTAA
jgi:hypothetical protein